MFNYVASPGQVGFPTSVASAPLPAFPAGAVAPLRSLYLRPGDASYYNQYFPTSTLVNYQSGLWNPYSEQWTFGIQRRLAARWVLSVDYVGAHSLRIVRPLDVDPPSSFIRTAPGQVRTAQAANCTRPYWIWWYAQNGTTCNPNTATNPQPPYAEIQADVNDGYEYYDALDVNLSHTFSSRLSALISYTWSHAIDNVDPDATAQNPNDPRLTGKIENGNALFDQRNRLVISGFYILPGKVVIGGVATLASGLVYDYRHRRQQQRRRRHRRPPRNQWRSSRPQHRPWQPDLRFRPVPGAPLHALQRARAYCPTSRSVQRLQPRQFRGLQRHLGQRRHRRRRLRSPAGRHHQPVTGAIGPVLSQDRILKSWNRRRFFKLYVRQGRETTAGLRPAGRLKHTLPRASVFHGISRAEGPFKPGLLACRPGAKTYLQVEHALACPEFLASQPLSLEPFCR